MNQNYLTNEQNSLRMIQLDEVGHKVDLKDRGAIRKWLRTAGISLHKIGKSFYVYGIEVDYAMVKGYVMSLRSRFPDRWQQLYKVVCTDQTLFDYTLFMMQEEPVIEQLTKVKPQSKEDKKLLQDLLQ